MYKLFKRSYPDGPDTFVHDADAEEPPTAEDFKKFLKTKSVYIGLAGCVKEMDEFVVIFRLPSILLDLKNFIFLEIQFAFDYLGYGNKAKHFLK